MAPAQQCCVRRSHGGKMEGSFVPHRPSQFQSLSNCPFKQVSRDTNSEGVYPLGCCPTGLAKTLEQLATPFNTYPFVM